MYDLWGEGQFPTLWNIEHFHFEQSRLRVPEFQNTPLTFLCDDLNYLVDCFVHTNGLRSLKQRVERIGFFFS